MADLTEEPAAVESVQAPPAILIRQFFVEHRQMPTASRLMFSWKGENQSQIPAKNLRCSCKLHRHKHGREHGDTFFTFSNFCFARPLKTWAVQCAIPLLNKPHLAAKRAHILGMLRYLHLLDGFAKRRAIAGAVLAHHADLLCTLSLELVFQSNNLCQFR